MLNHHTTNRCFGGPGRPNCTNEKVDGMFCSECRAAMRTPRQPQSAPAAPVYTHCPCGATLSAGQVLCAPCEARELPKLFKQPRRSLRTKLIAALAVVLLAFALLACTEASNGACEAPTPCGANYGGNP